MDSRFNSRAEVMGGVLMRRPDGCFMIFLPPAGPDAVEIICPTSISCQADGAKSAFILTKNGTGIKIPLNGWGECTMKIKTLATRELDCAQGGCGECQTSAKSACKTSCGVANQPCEQQEK